MFIFTPLTSIFLEKRIKILFFASILVWCFTIPFNCVSQVNQVADQEVNMSIPALSLINFASDADQIITYSYSYLEKNNVEQVITPNAEDNTWLNYSSIVLEGTTSYITANISSGTLPADVTLKLVVSEELGYGSGSVGTPIGEIILTNYPQNIIVNIGSCFTGAGLNKGHKINFVWENPDSYDYSLKYENGEVIAVTYTITTTE